MVIYSFTGGINEIRRLDTMLKMQTRCIAIFPQLVRVQDDGGALVGSTEALRFIHSTILGSVWVGQLSLSHTHDFVFVLI